MLGEARRGASNWEVSLNYYGGAFTLEESQVVLAKSYPSPPAQTQTRIHTRARARPSPPPHPCLLPFPTKTPLHPPAAPVHPPCLPHSLPPSLRSHITVLVAGMERLRSTERLAHNHAFGRSVCGMLWKSAVLERTGVGAPRSLGNFKKTL